MEKHRFVVNILTALAALTFVNGAAAQPRLGDLAPPQAALVVTFETDGSPAADLRSDLAALDWESAQQTIRALLTSAGDDLDLSIVTAVSDIMSDDPGSAFSAAVEQSCPALAAPLRALGSGQSLPPLEAMLAVELLGFQPSLTALVQFEGAMPSTVHMLRMALKGCADSVTSAPMNGQAVAEELYHFGEGLSAVVLLLTNDGLLVAGSRGESVLAVLDRRRGEGGPSLADSGTLDAFARFAENGTAFGVAVRPAPVLDALELTFDATQSLEPGDDALIQRMAAALATLENLAAQWSIGDAGAVSEWAVTLDPEGADQALADLLLCDNCRISRPFLAPAGAVGLASSQLPLGEIIDYLSGYFEAAGATIDVRGWLGSELGVDLDRDLLDWLGSEVHVVMLEPQSTDLRSLLYGPGQLLMIPVASAEAATAGLERLEQALVTALDEAQGDLAEFPIALRPAAYDGVEYTRVQASANIDVGLGVVGNHLVLAWPATAFERVVDTFRGGAGFIGDPLFRSATALAPDQAQAISVHDTSAQLSAVADLARLLSQPLAFGVNLALAADDGVVDSSAAESSEGWPVDLEGISTQPLTSGTSSGELTLDEAGGGGDPYVDGSASDLYRLEGLEPGATVTVVMQSQDFDTMLYLLDGEQSVVLDYNDDAPDIFRSELMFTAVAGVDYLVQATSFGGSESGSYSLAVEVEAAPSRDEVETPGFAEILRLFELPAQVLDVLAANIGITTGYTVTEGNVLYSRSVTEMAR
ncbi:MAG: hypothetical protein WD273_07165 [Trueperaceae bacterium]